MSNQKEFPILNTTQHLGIVACKQMLVDAIRLDFKDMYHAYRVIDYTKISSHSTVAALPGEVLLRALTGGNRVVSQEDFDTNFLPKSEAISIILSNLDVLIKAAEADGELLSKAKIPDTA